MFDDHRLSVSMKSMTANICSESLAPTPGHLDGSSCRVALQTNTMNRNSNSMRDCSPSPSDHNRLRVPSFGKTPKNSNRSDGSPRSRGFSSSKDGDETAVMWGRAIRAESITRAHRHSASSHQILIHPAQDETHEHGQLPSARGPHPSNGGSSTSSDHNSHSPTCHRQKKDCKEEAFHQSLLRSNTILEEWARQLRNYDDISKMQSCTPCSPSYPDIHFSTLPPASWSRFPSHTREQRNSVAGPIDNVCSRDFAVKTLSTTGSVLWTTDRDRATGSQNNKSLAQSLSAKFSHSVRSRWLKFAPMRPATPSRDRSIRGKRRSSIQHSGNLEYPELELLPTTGGYKELRALEDEVADMKSLGRQKLHPSPHRLGNIATRPSIAEKSVGNEQSIGDFGTDLSRTSDMTSFIEGQASLVRICSPETPATRVVCMDPANIKGSSGSSGEQYLTPPAHLSSCENSHSTTPERTVSENTALRPPVDLTKAAFKSEQTKLHGTRAYEPGGSHLQ